MDIAIVKTTLKTRDMHKPQKGIIPAFVSRRIEGLANRITTTGRR